MAGLFLLIVIVLGVLAGPYGWAGLLVLGLVWSFIMLLQRRGT